MQTDLSAGPIKTADGYGIGFNHEINVKKADALQYGVGPHQVKAHQRRVKTKAGFKLVSVRSHENRGWGGFGEVYKLTETEKQQVRTLAEDFINRSIQLL